MARSKAKAALDFHTPINTQVMRMVLQREETSIDQLVVAFDHLITHSMSLRYGKRKKDRGAKRTREQSIARGRRARISQALCDLIHRKKIRRIRRGVYGPPLPVLYAPVPEQLQSEQPEQHTA